MPEKLSNSNWGESKNWIWENLKVHYRVIGENNKCPIVLIHGFGASSDHWRYNAKPLALKGFKVYAIDLIGFGRSDQILQGKNKYLDNYFWAKQLAAFLEEIVEIKKNGKAILIGNSLGALVAITTNALRPDLIKTVVAAPLPDPALINPIKFVMPLFIKKLKILLLKLFFNLLPLKPLINLIVNTQIINFALQGAYHKSISNDKELIRIISMPARRTNAAKALRSMCIGMSIRPKNITAPELLDKIKNRDTPSSILLIWGRQDKLIPLSLSKKLIKMYPWIKLLVFENAGHCPHDELPNYFNQSVLKWLEINLKSL